MCFLNCSDANLLYSLDLKLKSSVKIRHSVSDHSIIDSLDSLFCKFVYHLSSMLQQNDMRKSK